MPVSKRCEKCERTFDSKQALKDHTRNAPGHGERCNLCDRTYRSLSALKQHMKDSHAQTKGGVGLPAQMLVSQGASQADGMSIEGNIEETCESTSSTTSSIQTSSADEEPSVCFKCGSTFTTSDALDQHVRNKHGAFACDHCNGCFRTEMGLTDHCKSKHRKIDCLDCRKSFKTQEALDDHIRSKHPQLECPKCGRPFFTNESRAQHIKDVHGANNCPLCAKSFRSQPALAQHQVAKHSKRKLVRQGEPQEAGFVMVHGTLVPVVIAKYDGATQRFYETAPDNDTVGMEGDVFIEPP